MSEQDTEIKTPQKLWTKNFTIITLGTAVSLFGNVISGFATGLLVLDFTGSVFLFAIYMILFDLPKVIMPQIIGPILDKFSRRKMIYTLDFISAAIYGLFGLVLLKGDINYVLLTAGCAMLGRAQVHDTEQGITKGKEKQKWQSMLQLWVSVQSVQA